MKGHLDLWRYLSTKDVLQNECFDSWDLTYMQSSLEILKFECYIPGEPLLEFCNGEKNSLASVINLTKESENS